MNDKSSKALNGPRRELRLLLIVLLCASVWSGCQRSNSNTIAEPNEDATSELTESASPSGDENANEPLSLTESNRSQESATVSAQDEPVNSPRRRKQLAAEVFLAQHTSAVATGWWTPRATLQDRAGRNGVPTWEFDPAFASEAFRFVRIKYRSQGGYGPYGKWYTDYPDSDLNFSFRLQQLTTMNVHPEPLYLELTDPRIFDYPFMYMIEPGFITLSNAEVASLREYFDRGGFVMVDDFWGEREWYNFYLQMKRVFPNREPIDLPLDHPVFNLVYTLKEKPQVPSIHNWMRYGVTYERPDAQQVNYRAFLDDQGRIVMMICHNTDLGDGWEREGESREYFETFSEKWAYPMGINIVVYAMTH